MIRQELSTSAEMGETEAYGEVQGLLASLRDNVSDSHSVVIKECNELHIPIAALYPLEHGQVDCESFKGRNNMVQVKRCKLSLRCRSESACDNRF